LIRSSVAIVVVVAGTVVVARVVVEVDLAAGVEVVGASDASVALGVRVPATVGAEPVLLLQAVNASAARPKHARRFIVCTHCLQSPTATLTVRTSVSSCDAASSLTTMHND
jgi:hypothetical protein